MRAHRISVGHRRAGKGAPCTGTPRALNRAHAPIPGAYQDTTARSPWSSHYERERVTDALERGTGACCECLPRGSARRGAYEEQEASDGSQDRHCGHCQWVTWQNF